MSGEFDPVRKYLAKIDEAVTSPAALKRMQRQGARSATDAARSVGARLRLRNWHGRKLSAHEVDDGAALDGPWRLFDQGRRSRGEIDPRRAQAVRTPDGPRAHSSYGPSRGLGVYQDASNLAERKVPTAVHDQFLNEVSGAVR